MVKIFQETVKNYQQAKKYYDALQQVNNLVRDARKVQQTVLMLGDISGYYVINYKKMLTDPNFTSSELSAIASGYTKILEEAGGVLNDLKQVVNITTLSMTDKDRMDVVDDCYKEMMNDPSTAYLVDDAEFDRQIDELGVTEIGTAAGMYLERGMYKVKKAFRIFSVNC